MILFLKFKCLVSSNPSENNIRKRPFLRKRTGLRRFYKDDNGIDSNEPLIVKRLSARPVIEIASKSADISTIEEEDIEEDSEEDVIEIDEEQELKIFEQMEMLTGRSSFGSTVSWVERFVNNKLNLNSANETKTEISNTYRQQLSAASSPDSLVQHNIDTLENEDDEEEEEESLRPETRNYPVTEQVPSVTFRSLASDLSEMLKPHTQNKSVELQLVDSTYEDDTDHSDSDTENVEPSHLSAAVMTQLHKQDRRIKELKQEAQLNNQMRERLEKLELSLKLEKTEFETYKKKEQSKLDKYKAKLEVQSKNMEKVSEEADRLRGLNIDYQEKINTLNGKLENLEVEWKRKLNRLDMTNKKQQERIETLEKLNEKLEAEKTTLSTTQKCETSSDVSKNIQKKKIHFAEDNQIARISNVKNKPVLSQTQLPLNSKLTGYFPKTLKNKDSDRNRVVSRSSMKSSLSPTTNANMNSQNISGSNPLLTRITGTPSLQNKELWNEWNADESKSFGTENISKLNPPNNTLNTEGDLQKVYPNGTRKYVSKSGDVVRLIYKNGDIKETRPDGSIQYFYSELGIKQCTYPNGIETTSYSNGQIERKNPDGTTEVIFTNGCVKFIRSDGKEEFIFPDNTICQVNPNGERIMTLPNGQKEIHTDNYKRRIYPDGTTRTIYENGTFETVYPNTRIRLKDFSGNLLSDTIEKNGVRVPFT